jgi:hypothetical protein
MNFCIDPKLLHQQYPGVVRCVTVSTTCHQFTFLFPGSSITALNALSCVRRCLQIATTRLTKILCARLRGAIIKRNLIKRLVYFYRCRFRTGLHHAFVVACRLAQLKENVGKDILIFTHREGFYDLYVFGLLFSLVDFPPEFSFCYLILMLYFFFYYVRERLLGLFATKPPYASVNRLCLRVGQRKKSVCCLTFDVSFLNVLYSYLKCFPPLMTS